MTSDWKAGSVQEVKLDLSRLKGEPGGADTRYTVGLSGPVGEQWVEALVSVQAESPAHRRFELDASRSVFRFSCRTVDGTGLVFEVLERLEALVERVNQIVAVRRAAGARIAVAPAALRAR